MEPTTLLQISKKARIELLLVIFSENSYNGVMKATKGTKKSTEESSEMRNCRLISCFILATKEEPQMKNKLHKYFETKENVVEMHIIFG